jgi:hypothetical protein
MASRAAARLAASFLLLAACGGSRPYDAESNACVEHINSLRASVGLGPLSRWKDAESCADSQAESDSETGVFHGAFNRCEQSAQNECPGTSWHSTTGPAGIVPGCLDMMWSQGPGEDHHDAMASTRFTMVACGFHQTSSGEVWAVQDYR